MPTLIQKIQRARESEIPDSDTLNFLSSNPELTEKIGQARQQGISDSDTLNFLAANENRIDLGAPEQQARKEEINAQSGLQNFGEGLVEGAKSIPIGTAQTVATIGNNISNPFDMNMETGKFIPVVSDDRLDIVNENVRKQQEDLDLLTDQSKAAQAGRVTGEFAALAPLSFARPLKVARGATTRSTFGKFGAQGAIAGSTFPIKDSENVLQGKLQNTALGAGLGVVLPAGIEGAALLGKAGKDQIGNAIDFTVERVLNNPSVKALFNDRGKLTKAGAKVFKEEGIDLDLLDSGVRNRLIDQTRKATAEIKGLTPEQRLRQAEFEEIGLTDDAGPTLGQITRDKKQQTLENQLRNREEGVGLDTRFETQNTRILGNKDRFLKIFGGKEKLPEDVGAESTEVLVKKLGEAKGQVDEFYSNIRETIGPEEEIIVSDVLSTLGEFEPRKGLVRELGFLEKEVKRLGALNAKRKGLTAKEGEVAFTISLEDMELLRRKVQKFAESAKTGFEESTLRSLTESIDRDVISSLGEDVFESARRFAEKVQFKPFETKALQGIINDKIAKDDVVQKIIVNGKFHELQRAKQTILSSKDGGKQVWDNLRSQTFLSAWKKATTRTELNKFEEPIFKAKAFEQAIASLGEKKLDILFTKGERAALGTFIRATKRRIPLPGTVNFSGTTNSLISFLETTGKVPIPGLKTATSTLKGLVSQGDDAVQRNLRISQSEEALNPSKFARKSARRNQSERLKDNLRVFEGKVALPELGVTEMDRRQRGQ